MQRRTSTLLQFFSRAQAVKGFCCGLWNRSAPVGPRHQGPRHCFPPVTFLRKGHAPFGPEPCRSGAPALHRRCDRHVSTCHLPGQRAHLHARRASGIQASRRPLGLCKVDPCVCSGRCIWGPRQGAASGAWGCRHLPSLTPRLLISSKPDRTVGSTCISTFGFWLKKC